MKKRKWIDQSKDVLGGTAVFSGTRVPVQSLIDYYEEGKTIHDFLNDFPTVHKKQAMIALEALKAILTRKKHALAA